MLTRRGRLASATRAVRFGYRANATVLPMNQVGEVLRGAWAPSPRASSVQRRLLVAGGAGTLGSAVLEAALGLGRFARVTALCRRPMGAALQGLGMLAVEGSTASRRRSTRTPPSS